MIPRGVLELFRWLGKEENSEDLLLAIFLLVTFLATSIVVNNFVSFANRPSYEFTFLESWIIFPIKVIITFLALIGLIFFEIKLTKRKWLRKMFNDKKG